MRFLGRLYAPLFSLLAAPSEAGDLRRRGAGGAGPGRRRSSSAANSCPSSKRAISGSARPCPSPSRCEQSARYVGRMRAIVRGCPTDEGAPCTKEQQRRPEIQTVISQLGRPDDGTDVSGFYNIELLAPLCARERVAQGRHQGIDDRGDAEGACQCLSRRGVQLLAGHFRQRRRGHVGRQGGEHRQGGRARSARQRDQGRGDRRRAGARYPAWRIWASFARSASPPSASRLTARRSVATASIPATLPPSCRPRSVGRSSPRCSRAKSTST